MLLMGLCPRVGLTLTDVRFQPSCEPEVVLIVIPALPTVQSFTQSDDAIYVSGDVNAFGAAHKSTPIVIVSLGFTLRDAFADSFPRR
jgi:hypothetical protein